MLFLKSTGIIQSPITGFRIKNRDVRFIATRLLVGVVQSHSLIRFDALPQARETGFATRQPHQLT